MGVVINAQGVIVINSKLRILLADDCESFGVIFCEYMKLFKDDGLEVIGVAKNGLDAVKMINTMLPDVVLLDLLMPRLDGLGVLRVLRDKMMLKLPFVIMLSAAGDPETIQLCLDSGALFYVEKPFDMNELIARIIQLKDNQNDGITS